MFLCQIKLRVILEEGFARTYIRLKPWPSGAGQNKLGSKLWINFYEVRDRLNQRLSENKTKMFDSRCLPQTQALRCFAAFEDCQCGLMSPFLMLLNRLQFSNRMCQRSNLAKYVIQDYFLAVGHLFLALIIILLWPMQGPRNQISLFLILAENHSLVFYLALWSSCSLLSEIKTPNISLGLTL